ncbi:hypothetical protein PG994_015166 [Apiospora phragmitis]|uniref:Velvet domain-containing protein n=1 Tax=Apiospora phragmitis TaxID=2905665 RepID=A0ABR1SVQ4_9PEZI
MEVEVQPFTVIQAGVVMKCPFIISTSAPCNFFHAVLVNLSGKVLEDHLMSEPVTTPKILYANPGHDLSAKALHFGIFRKLTIVCSGRYKIRVDAHTVDSQGATCQQCVVSSAFTVQSGPVDSGKPTPDERSILRWLKKMGIRTGRI